MFVVYYCEHLHGSKEEEAGIVNTIDEALAVIDRVGNGFAGSNFSFKLFHLGAEIPLRRDIIEEPKPVEVVKRVKFSINGKMPRKPDGVQPMYKTRRTKSQMQKSR